METELCSKCQQPLAKGAIKYRLKIQMISDFDGYIPFDDWKSVDHRIENILQYIENSSAEELEKSVYEEREYLLCPMCRERFMANPLNLPLDMDIPDVLPGE